jgi:hypothetical protein
MTPETRKDLETAFRRLTPLQREALYRLVRSMNEARTAKEAK